MADIFALIHNSSRFDNEYSGADVLLPVQFHDGRSGAKGVEPLHRLMSALLVDAMRCVQTKVDARQRTRHQGYADARSWIFSDDDRALFSFKAVCDALGMNPNAIRKYLVR